MGVLVRESDTDEQERQRDELPTLARFPAVDPARSKSADRPGRSEMAPAAPPNTRSLTVVIVCVLLVVCLAWVAWPDSGPRLPGDLDESATRPGEARGALISQAEASPTAERPAGRLLTGIEPAPIQRSMRSGNPTLMGYIVEHASGDADGKHGSGLH